MSSVLPPRFHRLEDLVGAVGLAGVAVAGGVAVVLFGLRSVLVVGGSLLVLFLAANRRYLAIALVLAMFVTRPVASVGPVGVRPEIVVGVAAFISIFGDILRRRKIPRYQLTLFLVLYLWIVYLAVVSIFNSVDIAKSISTLVWMSVCVTAAFWISINPKFVPLIVRVAVRVNLVFAVTALVLYAVSNIAGYGVGAQYDPAYGGYAVYVLSIEANILGGLVCIWSIICIADPLHQFSSRLRLSMLFIGPAAILATHTRAALVAFVFALVVLAMTRGKLLAFAAVVGAVAWMGLPTFAQFDPGLAKFATGLNFSGGTEIVRYNSWQIAWADISSSATNLVFGLGFNSYGQRHLDPTVPDSVRPSYLGNLPLQLIYDGGLISLLVIFMVVVATWRRSGRAIGFGTATSVLVAYMTISIGTSVLWLLETWMLVGLAAVIIGTDKPGEEYGEHASDRRAAP